MGFADKFKDVVDKGKDAVSKNSDKIGGAVDKAGDFVDKKTKGKYSDKIEKGTSAAKKAIPPQQPPQA
jgi:hypothetical protein